MIPSLLLVASLSSAESTGRLVADVTGVPPDASAVILIADYTLPPPEPTPGRGGRFRRQAAPTPVITRTMVPTNGAGKVQVELAVPAAEGYRVRVAAIAGDGPMRTLVAGAQATELAIPAETATPLAIALEAPTLALAPENPAKVPAGEAFTLKGIVTDPAGSLVGRDRMRVWMSAGAPAKSDFSGLQRSTVEATREGDQISFAIDAHAPAEPTTLYLQFGELSPLFSGDDGTLAVFLAVPRAGGDARQPTLRVESAGVAQQ